MVAARDALWRSEASAREGYESKNIGKDTSGHEITDIPE